MILEKDSSFDETATVATEEHHEVTFVGQTSL
jgi:hypothetical protein